MARAHPCKKESRRQQPRRKFQYPRLVQPVHPNRILSDATFSLARVGIGILSRTRQRGVNREGAQIKVSDQPTAARMRNVADKSQPVTRADYLGPVRGEPLMRDDASLEVADVVGGVVH